jgi:sugar O-acyltransferase (sialic acid O-acetyltransferase NeuD family)
MPHYTCLGYSEATIAMLFESLYSHYHTNFGMTIVQNMNLPAQHAFAIEGVQYDIISFDALKEWHNKSYLLGVGMPNIKKIVFEFFVDKFNIQKAQYETLVHTSAQIAQTATVGEGTHINPLCAVAPFAQIGNFVTLNRLASVGHHTTVGNFCTIAPNASIAGHCRIEESVQIGISATVLDGIRVGKDSIIGAGALVTKDIPAGVIAYGNPAKVIRENK